MPAIVLPDGYHLVIAAATSTVWLNIYQYLKVGQARKKSGIKYPQLYAEKAETEKSKDALIFNCVQRAHQNTLETLPFALLGTFVTGLWRPQLAAGLMSAWVVGRFFYTIGYSTGEPSKRNTRGGIISSLSVTALIFTSTYTSYLLLAGNL